MSARVQRAVSVRPASGRANAAAALPSRLPSSPTLTQRPPAPRSMAIRVVLVLVGTAVSSYGYLMTAVAGVGNGPMFAVQDGLQQRLGISTGSASILIALVLAALAVALRAPLGIGTIVIPIVSGLWMDLLEPFVVSFEPLAARWTSFLVGTAVMMFGAVVSVAAAFGTAAIDGVMLSLARIARRTPARVRIAIEVAMAALGLAIGGRVGLGTIVIGLSVGPLFGFWSAQLTRWGFELPTHSSRHVRAVTE